MSPGSVAAQAAADEADAAEYAAALAAAEVAERQERRSRRARAASRYDVDFTAKSPAYTVRQQLIYLERFVVANSPGLLLCFTRVVGRGVGSGSCWQDAHSQMCVFLVPTAAPANTLHAPDAPPAHFFQTHPTTTLPHTQHPPRA